MAHSNIEIIVTPAPTIAYNLKDSTMVKTIVQRSGAEACVTISHNPSVQVYFALRRKIEQSDDAWLEEFLALDGLESLVDSLSQMTGKAFTNFSDAILMLDCICCIRSILNRQIGLEFMLQQEGEKSFTRKLVTALDSGNMLPKKQVYEMMAVIAVHGSRGFNLVLDALEHFKKETNQSHMFSVIVNELKDADTVAYKTAILTLMNCVIMCTGELAERCRIRDQFVGLQLLDVLSFLSKEDADEDLSIQLEKFHVHKHRDEEEQENVAKMNMSDPQQLLHEIMKKIFATQKEASLTQVLQDLLFLTTSCAGGDDEDSDRTWNVLKSVVHQLATDTKRETFTVDHHRGIIVQDCMGSATLCSCMTSKVKQTQNALLKSTCKRSPFRRGDNVHIGQKGNVASIAKNLFELKPDNYQLQDSPAVVIKNKGRILRLSSPSKPPSQRMRSLRWIPVSQEDIEGSDSCTIWEREEGSLSICLNHSDLESMFADDMARYKDFQEVQLLEPSVRLKLNLFLERLEVGADDLVSSLKMEDPLPITLTGLKCLYQVLPTIDEIAAVRRYDGSRGDLGTAEQFLLYLSDLVDYDILLEGHLTRSEFTSTLNKLKSSLKAQSDACQEILDNTSLVKFFNLVLEIGNFLNHDQFNGSAAGFKLETLSRLSNVRSAIPNKTLLHYLVQMADDKDDSLLQFLNDFSNLSKASKCSVDELKSELNEMNTRLRKLIHKLSRASSYVRDVFELFLEDVRQDFATFQSDVNSLRLLSHKVALYFCETEEEFCLQTCFTQLAHFCKAVKKCREENKLFGKQQRLAVNRMTQLKSQVKNRRMSFEFGKEAGASSSFVEDKTGVLENLLTEIHRGNFRPLAQSDLTTPDMETNPLVCLSPIERIFSPYKAGQPLPPIASMETLNDFTLVASTETLDLSVYDLPDDYQQPFDAAVPIQTGALYHTAGDHQYHSRPTTLFPILPQEGHESLDQLPKQTQPPNLVTQPLKQLTQPPKQLAQPQKQLAQQRKQSAQPPKLPTQPVSGRVKGHHRSRSDLLESYCADEKWVMYEERKHLEKSHTQTTTTGNTRSDNQNRHSALYSLDLVDNGKITKNENIFLPVGPVVVRPGDEPFKRTKNRSSLRNFLTKISGGGRGRNGSGKDKETAANSKANIGEYTKTDKENAGPFKRFGSQRAKKANILKARNK